MKLSFRELASRITGISLPVFGISWNPPESERDIVRSVLVFLEDRRALYNPFALEIDHEVAQSVLDIRRTLTDAIQRLPEGSKAVQPLRVMRAACRDYLDNSRRRRGPHFGFLVELGKLRTIFGYQIAYLAIQYGLDIEGDLVDILPAEYREDATRLDAEP